MHREDFACGCIQGVPRGAALSGDEQSERLVVVWKHCCCRRRDEKGSVKEMRCKSTVAKDRQPGGGPVFGSGEEKRGEAKGLHGW